MKKNDAITDLNIDFAQWYTDVVKKANLIEYAPVKGCVIFKPYSYRMWEIMQSIMDSAFKSTGVENVYMPLFMPKSLLEKEADHVEGFAPEVATISHMGDEKLEDPLCVRPTSETLFCTYFNGEIQSYRDLPILLNQWCSVVRWEKTTRPFLRTTEFLWQEGHTAHMSLEEADERAKKMLDVYTDFFENTLAIPVIRGKKSEKEKFAGAHTTYTIESIMKDGKALQSATSHNLGDGFAKAFDITYTDADNQLKHVYQTSWGSTTRMIGAVIMVHGDNNGLVLPPRIAPIQVVVIPVAAKKPGVIEKNKEIYNQLKDKFRAKIDESDKNPGWKFSEYEMKGVPIRLELGPKDIEANQCVLARRDTGEKITVSLDNISTEIEQLLSEIQKNMYETAKKSLKEKTYVAKNFTEFEKIIEETPGFISAMWCGKTNCEEDIKKKTSASTRCIPFESTIIADKCVHCGDKAEYMVYFAKAY